MNGSAMRVMDARGRADDMDHALRPIRNVKRINVWKENGRNGG